MDSTLIETRYRFASAFPTYLVNRLYDMTATKEHVISLAEYIISETGTQDPKVGGPIGIAVISPDSGYRELDESEVADVRQKNQEEMHKLREHFAGQ